jgi:4-amino-4-deoxy-L-arabinose transferase-like glycosyltransferase
MLRKHYLIIIICVAAILARIALIRIPVSPWWDPAIYVGMGKYFFSGGTIGLWEILRPPLWPLIIGFGWFIGLAPLLFSKILVAIAGIGTIILLYIWGEREEKGLGLAAALILALAPIYTFFVTIPTNDIPSVFVSLAAAYCVYKRKYFGAGLLVGIAFLLRFPHGLFLVPFSFFILIDSWHKDKRIWIKKMISRGLWLTLGFACLAIPYFIINFFLYGDPLLPIKLGNEIIANTPGEPVSYYIQNIFKDNPLLFLSLIGLVVGLYKIWKHKTSRLFVLSFFCVIIVGGYFNYLGHKEFRYSFPFVIFLIIIAAYGLQTLWQLSAWPKAKYVALVIIAIIGIGNMYMRATREQYILLANAREKYYEALPPKSKVITSSPQIMLGSDALLIGTFATWEGALNNLREHPDTEYIAVDGCQVFCNDDMCAVQKKQFLDAMSASSTVVYSGKDGQCDLTIYHLH